MNGNTVKAATGERSVAPDFTGEDAVTELKDVTDTTLELGVNEHYRDLEYTLYYNNENGEKVWVTSGNAGWQSPVEGVLTFDGITPETYYYVTAHTPAADQTLPSIAVDSPGSAYFSLMSEQNAQKQTFESAYQTAHELEDIARVTGAMEAHQALWAAEPSSASGACSCSRMASR